MIINAAKPVMRRPAHPSTREEHVWSKKCRGMRRCAIIAIVLYQATPVEILRRRQCGAAQLQLCPSKCARKGGVDG
jgi:hypothetical protein